MHIREIYRAVGWRNEFWEYIRLYRSLRGNAALSARHEVRDQGRLSYGDRVRLDIEGDVAARIDSYLDHAEVDADSALAALRTEDEALLACTSLGVLVGKTRTQSKDHHQSAKALVAEVSAYAQAAAAKRGVPVETNPQRRAVWANDRGFHVTARNLDGALPGLYDPIAVWEIKEYWGTTAGGSKMSDAVYECQLVGRELREFCERSGASVAHVVFLDGRSQWQSRRSDLVRFVDLFHQGLIDHLIVGAQTQVEWPALLESLLAK